MGRRSDHSFVGLGVTVVACFVAIGWVGIPVAGAQAKASAKLGVLDENVLVSKKSAPKKFAKAKSGAKVASGDSVRTNDTGFAELAYGDGALTRLDVNTTFTLTELGADDQVQAELSGGQIWNEVETATGGEASMEIETPNAVAVVRGTAFAIQCEGICTYAVVEGTVDVTAAGVTVSVPAGQQVNVDPSGVVGALEPIDVGGWIQQNLDQDRAQGREPPGDAPGGNPGQADGTAPKALAAAVKRDYNTFQEERVGARFDAVECRATEALKVGEATTCVGKAGGPELELRIVLIDKDGEYSWTRQASLIDLDRYEQNQIGNLTTAGVPIVSVACTGPRIQLVQLPGGTFECTFSDALGRTGTTTVTWNRAGTGTTQRFSLQ